MVWLERIARLLAVGAGSIVVVLALAWVIAGVGDFVGRIGEATFIR